MGEVFGDPVVAMALLDRLLHHAVVVPERIHPKVLIHPPSIVALPKRRGRPPKTLGAVTNAA